MSKARAPQPVPALGVEVNASAEESQAPTLGAPAAVVLAGLQRDIAALADRLASLPRRCAHSHKVLAAQIPQLTEELGAAGRKAAVDCGITASQVSKALEAGAEEARVQAAQLEAYVMLLEDEAEGGEEAGVEAAAHALLPVLSHASVGFGASLLVVIQRDATLLHAVEAVVRLRNGIDPCHCIVSGAGIGSYQPDFDNRVRVCVVDGEGDAVESIEAGDVHAIVSVVEGACVTSAALGEPGVIDVVYRVPEGSRLHATLGLSMCGAPLSRSPWTVSPLLVDSVILASVAPIRRSAFLRELSEWLPSRAYSLLYRGSRDGRTARTFHRLCDGRGPTLVLVQSKEGWVFGGYAGVSWESREGDDDCGVKNVASPDAFLLSVVGPHSTGPVMFPVLMADEALCCDAACGPVFTEGLEVRAPSFFFESPDRDDDMDDVTCLLRHGGYQDVLGQGSNSLTGHPCISPTEMEVFAVQRL